MADHTELVALGVGHHHPRHVVGLPDVDLVGAQPLQPSNQRRLVLFRGRGHIEMHTVLGRLGFRYRHQHQRQLAGLGGVITGRFDHHFVGLLERDRPLQRPDQNRASPAGSAASTTRWTRRVDIGPTVAAPNVSDKRQ
jgi:hypothetical protein